MIPIQDLLHRIQWDAEFGQGEFTIGYYDRRWDRVVKVPLQRIGLEPGRHFSFDVISEDGAVRMVPFHRVRKVWRNGELIWQRPVATGS